MRNIADVKINTREIANDINRFYISYLGTDNDPLRGLAYTNKQVRRPRPALLQFSHCIHFFFQINKLLVNNWYSQAGIATCQLPTK